MKVFRCGLCKEDNRIGRTREGLRKHLEEEHRILTEKFNTTGRGKKSDVDKIKKKWVIVEEII